MELRLTCNAGTLVIDGHRYALDGYRNLLLVSIGKAAGTMAGAFLHIVGDEKRRIHGIVSGVCNQRLPEQIRVFEGGILGRTKPLWMLRLQSYDYWSRRARETWSSSS